MQPPGFYNMECWQGANFDLQLNWTVAGSAINVTGYSARMQVRETADSTAVILSLVNGTGITLGGTAGTITLAASAATTAALPSGQFVYDLEMISGAGYVTRFVEGAFTVIPEVTR